MTREEAREFLEKCRWWFRPYTSEEEKWDEALDMAIESLQAKTDGDTISRQDAIDAICKVCFLVADYHKCDGYPKTSTWCNELVALRALPSAEPKTGEWVRLEREENVHDLHGVPTWGVNYMCDKCGFITTAIQDHFAQYKWCPSCGADMRGEE